MQSRRILLECLFVVCLTATVPAFDYCLESWAEWHNAADPIASTIRDSDIGGIIVADVNNDGREDVVIGTSSRATPVQYLTNMSGGWQTSTLYGANTTVYDLQFGDLDNDGQNETLIVSSDYFYMKNESGGFVNYTIYTAGYAGNIGAIGDADNDGLNEVVACEQWNDVEVKLWENISGGWENTYNLTDLGALVDCYDMKIGDADNDGLNEIVIGDSDGNLTVVQNESGGFVKYDITRIAGEWINALDIGDADNDNDNEIAVALTSTTYEFRLYHALSTGSQRLFYDNFSDNDMSDWDVSGCWDASSGYALCSNADAEHGARKAISTLNRSNIYINFSASTANHDAGENLTLYYYNGTAQKKLWSMQAPSGNYKVRVSSDANNRSDFAINFTCNNDAPNEDCIFDDVAVWQEFGFREENISDTPPPAHTGAPEDLMIIDRDNDGNNEIVAGMSTYASKIVLVYKESVYWYTVEYNFGIDIYDVWGGLAFGNAFDEAGHYDELYYGTRGGTIYTEAGFIRNTFICDQGVFVCGQEGECETCTITTDKDQYLPSTEARLVYFAGAAPSSLTIYYQNGSIFYESGLIDDSGAFQYNFTAPADPQSMLVEVLCNNTYTHGFVYVYQGFWDFDWRPLILLFIAIFIIIFAWLMRARE